MFVFSLPALSMMALGLFLLALAWSSFSLSQVYKFGGFVGVIFHMLLGPIVLVTSFDKVGAYFLTGAAVKVSLVAVI